MAATVFSLSIRTAGVVKPYKPSQLLNAPQPYIPGPPNGGSSGSGSGTYSRSSTNGNVNGASTNGTHLTNGTNGTHGNGARHSEDEESEDEESEDEESELEHSDSEDSEMEVPFSIYVNMPADFDRSNAWDVINAARIEIVHRIRSRNFSHGSLSGRVLRFDGSIPAASLAIVPPEYETEYVHRLLENWLLTMLDLIVQDNRVAIPYHAGYWYVEWN